MVPSTSEDTRQKKLTTTTTGPKWEGQRNILLPCKHQSEDVHDNKRGPRIQEDGQIGQRRQALDQTIQEKSAGTKPGPRQHCGMRHDLCLSARGTTYGRSGW